jgi:protein SCO1/2
MSKKVWRAACALAVFLMYSSAATSSPWGASYFPNTELTTHEGKKVKFFDDLIKEKVVVINFIYTSCPDVCPLETAQLTRVQKILGDRLGKDVFFYSITIDPETDTPEQLKEYRARFGAKWTFLTGNKQEIITLRRKLGLYIDEASDGGNENNHNVSMIIGNQSTGRWMKKSPFENPYVLADQIGNWLNGWKSVQQGKDYDEAPDLRPMTSGEPLFRTRCSSCHSVNGVREDGALGPDLLGVTRIRDQQWLVKWLLAPDRMISEKDPLALALLKENNDLMMPNLRLNRQEVLELIEYMDQLPGADKYGESRINLPAIPGEGDDLVAVMNAWIREAHPQASTNAGYLTLINTSSKSVSVIGARSEDFGAVEFHEMGMEDGMMQMRQLKHVDIDAESQVKFVPGGMHLMLKDPKRSLVEGDQSMIEFTFSSGKTQKIPLKVKKGKMSM